MKKIILITLLAFFTFTAVCSGADTKAKRIRVDASQFNNNLSSSATNVQKALDEIDNLSVIGETNTASNVGTSGTGVFKQKTGADLEFYKLNSTNALMTIGLDGLNKIDLTINEGSFNLGNMGGVVTDAQVPDNITITNAATADALSVNGGNCLSGYVPLGVDTFGATEGCFDVTTQVEFDNHPHSATDIASGTFANARVAQSNVTQHQAALIITESQISNLNHTVDTKLTQEEVQDFVGSMVAGNTETLISVTYDDLGNHFDFIVENDLGLFDWTNVDGVDLKVGSITQGWDADLDDLADGKLTNSKVTVVNGNQYSNFGDLNDDTIDELFEAIDLNWPLGGSGEANTASNQGVGGIGLFDQKSGVDLQFKNINTGSNKISVTNDAVNKEVDIDIVEANINHDALTNFVLNEHIDWTQASAGTVHSSNYVDNVDDTVSGSELDGVFSTNGILKRAGIGTYGIAVSGTDYTDIGNTVETGEITDGTINDVDVSSSADIKKGGFGITIDGGGSAITAGIKGDSAPIPYNCTIDQVTLTADQTGSIVIDLWKDTYVNFPPTVTDTITASAKPTLTNEVKYQDVTLTGWTTTINAGDFIRFNVDSASTLTRANLFIQCTKN